MRKYLELITHLPVHIPVLKGSPVPSLEQLVRGSKVELAHVCSGDPQQFLLLSLVELDDEVADSEIHQSLPFQDVAVGGDGQDMTSLSEVNT